MHERLKNEESDLTVRHIALIDGDSQVLIRASKRGDKESFMGTWDLATGAFRPLETPQNKPCFCCSSNGRFFLLKDQRENHVAVWDRQQSREMPAFPLPEEIFTDILSDDGQVLATFNAVWNTTTGKKIWSQEDVSRLMLVPSGKKIVISSGCQVIDLDTGKPIAKLPIEIPFSTFSPDSRSFLHTYHNRAKLFDLETGTLRESLVSPFELIGGAVSRDHRRLAVGGCFEGVRVWEIPSEDILATWRVRDRFTRRLCFSSDGCRLATSTDGGVVRLWDVHHQTERACLVLLNDGEWVTISPDGYFLGSAKIPELLQWQIEQQPVEFERYSRDHHRPDKVREALRG